MGEINILCILEISSIDIFLVLSINTKIFSTRIILYNHSYNQFHNVPHYYTAKCAFILLYYTTWIPLFFSRYVPWNLHEPTPRNFNFNGNADIKYVIVNAIIFKVLFLLWKIISSLIMYQI
jgi:hypothetical protein